jgi:hypothetical protein
MVSSLLIALALLAEPQESMIPEGTVLPVVVNERISTKTLQENDPVLFTLADDIRAGGKRGPVLIPRGSSVVGRIAKIDRAGHLYGRATIDIRIEEIVTSDRVYDGLSTKVVEIGKIKNEKGEVKPGGEINGPGHAKRDAFFLLFPPTTIFQVMATPGRGPDVELPVETRLFVKLMSPIYVERQTAEVKPAAPAPTPRAAVAPPVIQQAPPAVIVQTIPVPQPIPQVTYVSLDSLVSPVALYPDTILPYVLAASTHPLEVVEASQFLQQQNRNVPQPQWDPSIQALAGYPDLIKRLSNNITWTTNLGNAYLTRPKEVMDTVQRLRVQSGVYRY